MGAAGDLIALASQPTPGWEQIVVVDGTARVMSVYHVEHATGAITLKSVRSLAADLKLDEFNTASPLPREIRRMLNNE